MNGVRPTILVADPNAVSASLIARELRCAGYRTLTAASGDEALALIDERRPDACVFEVMLRSGPSGYELVRQLRSVAATAGTAAVLMSARAGKLDRDFAFTVGANDYFKKPFRCGDLVTRIESLVPQPDAEPQITIRRAGGWRQRHAVRLAAR